MACQYGTLIRSANTAIAVIATPYDRLSLAEHLASCDLAHHPKHLVLPRQQPREDHY